MSITEKAEWPDWANYAIYDEVGLWAYTGCQPMSLTAGDGPPNLVIWNGRIQLRAESEREPVGKYYVKRRPTLNEELIASNLCAMTIWGCEPDGNGNWRLIFTNGQSQIVKFLSDITSKPEDAMQKSIAAQIETGSDGPEWCRK
jgi:hypothetical protein